MAKFVSQSAELVVCPTQAEALAFIERAGRTAYTAHPQMRKVMRPLLVWCVSTYPVLFEDVGYLED